MQLGRGCERDRSRLTIGCNAFLPSAADSFWRNHDFFDQPKVADAVSNLFRDVFGVEKTSVRLVIGVASLPLGIPVELEVVFEAAE